MFLFLFTSELIVRWAADFYEFRENQLATVELVIESKFEVAQVAIPGCPSRIPDSDPYHRESLQECGPQLFPGNGELKLNNAAFCEIFETLNQCDLSNCYC